METVVAGDLQAIANSGKETRLVVKEGGMGQAKLVVQEKCLCETIDNPECEGEWVDHFCVCAYDMDDDLFLTGVGTVYEPGEA